MKKSELRKILDSVPAVKPDEWDKQLIREAKKDKSNEYVEYEIGMFEKKKNNKKK